MKIGKQIVQRLKSFAEQLEKPRKWSHGPIECQLQAVKENEWLLTATLFGKKIISQFHPKGEVLPEYLMNAVMPSLLSLLFDSWMKNYEPQILSDGERSSDTGKQNTSAQNRCSRCEKRRNDSKITEPTE